MTNTTLFSKRSYPKIITDGFAMYGKYFLPLTLPLVLPWIQIILGAYLWVAIPIGLFDRLRNTDTILLVLLLIFFVAMLPGMILFFRGFWQFLLYFAGLNSMVRDLMENNYCDPEIARLKIQSRTTDYGLLLGFICVLALLPIIATLFFALPIAVINLPNGLGDILLGFVLLLFSFLMLILYNFFSLSFQLFAFEPNGFIKVLQNSSQLVKHHFILSFALLLTSVITASVILPMIASLVSHFTHLIQLLNLPFHWLVNLYFLQLDFSQLPAEFQTLPQQAKPISLALTDLTIQSTVTSLLLPLGTIWHALLYGHIKSYADKN